MTIKCPKCEGRGQVPLPPALQATLDCVRRHPFASADLIHGAMKNGVGVTAINNRLEELRKLGLLGRKGTRRGYRYFPKPTAKP